MSKQIQYLNTSLLIKQGKGKEYQNTGQETITKHTTLKLKKKKLPRKQT